MTVDATEIQQGAPAAASADLVEWVTTVAELTKPDAVYWCDGSEEERDRLRAEAVASGQFIPLEKRPGSFLVRSDPADVARVESRTFICSEKEEDAGPTNNWADPAEMKATLMPLFDGSMRGRTLYVIPFSMGPLGGNISRLGVELTDSIYVVLNMRIMTRMGAEALKLIGEGQYWVPAVHTVGYPLVDADGNRRDDVTWPCNEEKYITHFPETREICPTGRATAATPCSARSATRCASPRSSPGRGLARRAHAHPEDHRAGRRVYHLTAAFPSACGKTNLAMLRPTIPGWKVETVGDDIAWMRQGEDGRLYAINPRPASWGRPRHLAGHQPDGARGARPRHDLHQRRADRRRRRVVGGHDQGAAGAPHRLAGQRLDAGVRRAVLPPQQPVHRAGRPGGVHLPRVGGPDRRADRRHPVRWPPRLQRAPDQRVLRLEPRRVRGRHRLLRADRRGGGRRRFAAPRPVRDAALLRLQHGDYWAHWFRVGEKLGDKAPHIFQVNWFRKDSEGNWLWPGFGDNARAIEWALRRINGEVEAVDAISGRIPWRATSTPRASTCPRAPTRSSSPSTPRPGASRPT
jgi:phosphoenolpyruvate carboxykinase (GTP)